MKIKFLWIGDNDEWSQKKIIRKWHEILFLR